MGPEEISRQLRGHTVVVELRFFADLEAGTSFLSVDLAEDESATASVVCVEFEGVLGLTLKEFGGGITQLLDLRIEDVSGAQWDRIAYSVTDIEKDRLRLLCRDIRIARRYLRGEAGARRGQGAAE